MENIVEILSYYTINDMFVNGSSEKAARKKAIGIIKDNFQREETYYIPKIWNGKKNILYLNCRRCIFGVY